MLGPLPVVQDANPFGRMAEAVKSHRSVTGTLRGVAFGRESTIRFRFLAPDCVDVEGEELGGRYVTNGIVAWAVFPSRKLYRKASPLEALFKARAVFGYNLLLQSSPAPVRSIRPEPSADPMRQDVVLVIPPQSRDHTVYPDRMTVTFDPRSGLPLGMRAPGAAGAYRYESIQLDPPLTRRSFGFVPPTGYHEDLPQRSRPLLSLSLPMFAQKHAKLGEWVEDGSLSLRVASKTRAYGGSWIYELEFRKPMAYLWSSASATVRRREEWRIATLGPLRDGGRRAIVSVPREGWTTPPESLSLNLTRDRVSGGSVTLIFGR